jgi:hypothetical protein
MRKIVMSCSLAMAIGAASCVADDPGAGDATPIETSIDDLQAAAIPNACKKGIRVSFRTNYGVQAFDPTRKASNEYPNNCWIDNDPSTPGLQVENINGPTWRRCGKLGCEPTTGKTHWYYDDTAVGTTTQDKADIALVHAGMGDIKGTVDMANRGAGWNYFQMNANGATNIIDRWFAETHAASGDHAGCEFQENDYIDDWVRFVHSTGNYAIRPQLVVMSADHRCASDGRAIENCPAAYLQIKHACSLIGSGRTIGLTAEGGLKLEYGHCLGDVIKALNECTCSVNGGCF